jgi:protein-tyrosine phosphatase
MKGLVANGCLMQVTAGSLMGAFGGHIQDFSTTLVEQGLVHFIASDAHGVKSRRPLLSRAYQRVAELVGPEAAQQLCCTNPRRVADGRDVQPGTVPVATRRKRSWFGLRKAG